MLQKRLYIPLIVLLLFESAFYLRMLPDVGVAWGNHTEIQDVKVTVNEPVLSSGTCTQAEVSSAEVLLGQETVKGDPIVVDRSGTGTNGSWIESTKTEPDDRTIRRESTGSTTEDNKKQYTGIDSSMTAVIPPPSVPSAPGPRQVVLLGDSMTQAISTVDPLQGFYVLNKGIIGNTSKQMLDRIQSVVSANPSKVFIMAGTNDLWGGWDTDTTLKNYNSMVEVLQGGIPDCKIYIQSTLPFGKVALDKNPLASNEKVEQLNMKLRQLAQSKGLVYLDIASLYKDEQGMLSSRYTGDGIHINCQYYTLWLDVLRQNLRS